MDNNRTNDISLPEGQYYHDQIIGLKVQTSDGRVIGTVVEILTGQSNDNLIVRSDNEEVLIPVIEDVIQSIDLPNRLVTIEPVDGLLELNVKKS